jgi:hypothetical protein
MPKRIYNGAHPEVELVLPERTVNVKHGESIEIPDEIARNLDEQEDNWIKPDEKPKTETKERA